MHGKIGDIASRTGCYQDESKRDRNVWLPQDDQDKCGQRQKDQLAAQAYGYGFGKFQHTPEVFEGQVQRYAEHDKGQTKVHQYQFVALKVDLDLVDIFHVRGLGVNKAFFVLLFFACPKKSNKRKGPAGTTSRPDNDSKAMRCPNSASPQTRTPHGRFLRHAGARLGLSKSGFPFLIPSFFFGRRPILPEGHSFLLFSAAGRQADC